VEPIQRLREPLLIVNFKTYIEATGKKAIELAKSAEKVAKETGITIVVVPQFSDIRPVSENVDITVFSQHLDPVEPGAFTGHILAEAVKSAGAEGTLLNHSERRIGTSEISKCVQRCIESGLHSLVCSDTVQASARIAAEAKPDMIAIEPPDLIGTGISVSKARPELITDGIKGIRAVNPKVTILCGAGITTHEDVSKALKLGAEGVLVASSIVKNKDPVKILDSMAKEMLEPVNAD
jgi:triosephosphate isomerase (TIM)